MVKLGFIGEGADDKNVLESTAFRSYLDEIGLDYLPNVINASGGGKLLPKHLEPIAAILKDRGATHIVILADKEDDPCITATKSRIDPEQKYLTIVAVRQIENWFLADSEALSNFFKKKYSCDYPEAIKKPKQFFKTESIKIYGRGVNPDMLARRMIQSGFSISKAAAHPMCPSAKYFVEKLKALSSK